MFSFCKRLNERIWSFADHDFKQSNIKVSFLEYYEVEHMRYKSDWKSMSYFKNDKIREKYELKFDEIADNRYLSHYDFKKLNIKWKT